MSGIRINEIPRDSLLDGKNDLVHVYKIKDGVYSSVAAPVSALAFQGPAGLEGTAGTNGVDGLNGSTIAQLVCYRRFAPDSTVQEIKDDQPGNNGNKTGSFDFSNRVFTEPEGWSGGVPPVEFGKENWVLYSCNGVAQIAGTSGVDDFIVWSTPTSSGIDGLPGSDGTSTYQAVVFTRSSDLPDRAQGGSFNFGSNTLIPPLGPTATPPGLNDIDWYIDVAGDLGPVDDGTQLWMCNYQFSIVGDTDTAYVTGMDRWSPPTRFAKDGADGISTYYGSVYLRSQNVPAKPGLGVEDGGGEYSFTENKFTELPAGGWTEEIPEYNGEPLWISQTVASISGPVGVDDSVLWTLPKKVMQPAVDGNNGDVVAQLSIYKRAIGTEGPTLPVGGSFDFESRIITPPSEWTATPTAATVQANGESIAEHDFLYVSVGVASRPYNHDDGIYGIDTDIIWSDPEISPTEGIRGASSYLAQVYTRYTGDEDITVDSYKPTGGSFNFGNNTLTVPSSNGAETLVWSDRIPGGLGEIYISQQQFGIIGNTGISSGGGDWSAPAVMAYTGTAGYNGVTNKTITLYYGADEQLTVPPTFPDSASITVQLDAEDANFGNIITGFGGITITDKLVHLNGVNTGWCTHIPGDKDWVYAIQATAADSDESDTIKTDVIVKNDWSDTILWRKPGSNGLTGLATGTVKLYIRNNSNAAPSAKPSGPINYYVLDTDNNKRGDLVVPGGSSLNGWSIVEPSYNGDDHYLWCITATSSTRNSYDIIQDTEWLDTPFLYSQNPFDLTQSTVSHIVQAYKRSSVLPSDNPGSATVHLAGESAGVINSELSNGWSKVIPSDGDQDIYVTHATVQGIVASNDGTELGTIQQSSWTDPAVMGTKGDTGERGFTTKPVAIYKRSGITHDADDLLAPTGPSVYTFAGDGSISFQSSNGWSLIEPTTKSITDRKLWQRWATAVDTGIGTDTINEGEWGPAINIGVDGTDGTSFLVKGRVNSISELPSGAAIGDAYVLGSDLHMWDGNSYNNIGDIQGPVGDSSYLHVKYATQIEYNVSNNITSINLTGNDGEDVGEYIGIYVSNTSADPTVQVDGLPYKWKLMQGKDGRSTGTRAYPMNSIDPAIIKYDSSEDALTLYSANDNTVGMSYTAFNVDGFNGDGKTVKFDIPIKSSTIGSDKVHIRVYEYYSELPAGKLAIGDGITNFYQDEPDEDDERVQTRDNYIEYHQGSIGTSYEVKSFEYIPSSSTKWASVVILNWNGTGNTRLHVKPVVGAVIGATGTPGVDGHTPTVVNVYKQVGLTDSNPTAPGEGVFDVSTKQFSFNSNQSNGWSVTPPSAKSGKRIFITSASVSHSVNLTTGSISVAGSAWSNITDNKATVTWSIVPGRTAPSVAKVAEFSHNNKYITGADMTNSPWSDGQYFFGKNTQEMLTGSDSIDVINMIAVSNIDKSGKDVSAFIADINLTLEILFKKGASWIMFKRVGEATTTSQYNIIPVEVIDKSEDLLTAVDLNMNAVNYNETLPTQVPAIFGYTPAVARDTVYLYQRTNSSTAPAKPTTEYKYNFNSGNLTNEGTANNWKLADDSNISGKYLWRIHATASGKLDVDTGEHIDIIPSSEWKCWLLSQAGIDGDTGISFSQKFLYTRTDTSTPGFINSGWIPSTKPGTLNVSTTINGSDNIGRVKSADKVQLEKPSVIWYEDIPDQAEGSFLWVIVTDIRLSGSDYFEVVYDQWSEPVSITQNGTGLNTAVVELFARTYGTVPVNDRPTGSLTYDFNTGNITGITSANLKGWSKNIPSDGGNMLWVIRATASNTTATDNINTWSDPSIYVTDGSGLKFIGSFPSRAKYIEHINNNYDDGIPPVNSYHIEPEGTGSQPDRKVSLLYSGGNNSTDKNSGSNFTQMTVDGKDGVDGSTFKFLGSFASNPSDSVKGDMYKNTNDNIVYIHDGEQYQVMVSDGAEGPESQRPGPDGKSIFIAYSTNDVNDRPDTPGENNGISNRVAYAAYSNPNQNTISYNEDTNEIMLQSDTDSDIGMAFPAFNVDGFNATGKKIKFDIPVKSSSNTSNGLYIRVYEYNSALPDGKLAVSVPSSGGGSSALVQDASDGSYNSFYSDVSITTEYVTKSFEYTPPSSAKWASVVILNWNGMGDETLYVKPFIGEILNGTANEGLTDTLDSNWTDTSSAAANWMSQKIALTRNDSGIPWGPVIRLTGAAGEAGFRTVPLTIYRRADTASEAGSPTIGGSYDFTNGRFSPPENWSSTIENAGSDADDIQPATPSEGVGWEWKPDLVTMEKRDFGDHGGNVETGATAKRLYKITSTASVQVSDITQRDTSISWGLPQPQSINGVDIIEDTIDVDRVYGSVKNGGGVAKIVATDRADNLLTQAAYDSLGGAPDDIRRGDYGWISTDGVDPDTMYIIF
jgi:hypothetical protein